MELRNKVAIAAAATAVSLAGAVVFAGMASAESNDTPLDEVVSFEAFEPSTEGPAVAEGGAYDLNGNPVETETLITDEAPSETDVQLGDLRREGTVEVSEGPAVGSFGN